MTKTIASKTQTAAKPAAKAPRADERNGIRPPTRAGVVLQIWTTFEAMPGLTTADLPQLAEESGWSLGLTRSWFRQWRKWHGHTSAKKTTTKAPAKG